MPNCIGVGKPHKNNISYERNLFVHELRGAFNKFPDFFVQAFRIVVNS